MPKPLEYDGICPKCNTQFERPKYVPLNHPGYICPECKRKGYAVCDVVSFTPDIRLNILPQLITTA